MLREINPEYLLEEGLMLKLNVQYFGHLMQTADSLEKSLILGKIEGRRRRGCQRLRWLNGITNAKDMNLGKLLARCSPWGHKESDMTGKLNNNNLKNIFFQKLFLRIIIKKAYGC